MLFPSFLLQCQERINHLLSQHLPSPQTTPQHLHQAMAYAVLNGGKRIRPTLIYATAATLNTSLEKLDDLACAIELIHAYSLAHDDLPAMDDDDLRRGQPTCHKAFDEATAILVGDALQSLAFEILADTTNSHITLEARLKLIHLLGKASGSQGMAGGQALDLQATGKNLTLTQLEQIHRLKTGALIHASIYGSALACEASAPILTALDEFAKLIGLAFQIQDDILDIESTTEILGKQQGADLTQQKATYPAIAGIIPAKIKLEELYQSAHAILKNFAEPNSPLVSLVDHLGKRNF